MQRRSFLALLATLPLFKWSPPKSAKAGVVTDGSQSFSTSCFIGHDRAVPGTDKTYFTISGTDIHGNFVTETIEIPPMGFSAVSKHSYKELHMLADVGNSGCPLSLGCSEDGWDGSSDST